MQTRFDVSKMQTVDGGRDADHVMQEETAPDGERPARERGSAAETVW